MRLMSNSTTRFKRCAQVRDAVGESLQSWCARCTMNASRWTPWDSYLTAEESWSDPAAATSPYGRLFEVTNPLADPDDTNIAP